MKNKAVFLDRDGVVNIEKHYVHKIADFKFIEGIFQAVSSFNRLGYLVIIITNQSGIGRGYYTENDFQQLNDWMLANFKKNGSIIDHVYYCPHNPNANCLCRKPNSGMIDQAVDSYNIDVKSSWLVGDKESDIKAGFKAGIKNLVLVKTGHEVNERTTGAKYVLDSILDTIHLIC